VCLLLALGGTWMMFKTGSGAAGSGSSGSAAYLAHRGAAGSGNVHRKTDAQSMGAFVNQMSTNFDGFVDMPCTGRGDSIWTAAFGSPCKRPSSGCRSMSFPLCSRCRRRSVRGQLLRLATLSFERFIAAQIANVAIVC
jgi:hypothetical protein